MNVEIEKASINDINQIIKLIYDRCLWFKERKIVGWDIEFYPKKYNCFYFLEQLDKSHVFVAKCDNKVVGAMVLKNKDNYWKDDSKAYYIHHLVSSTFVKGIGNKLIERALLECKLNNKKYLRLDCFKNSIFLNNYYKSIGFKNIGSGKDEDYNYNLWEMEIK